MKLIYRGYAYSYVPAAPKLYVKPCVVNWRYQVLSKGYSSDRLVAYHHHMRQPVAINWRFRLAMGD